MSEVTYVDHMGSDLTVVNAARVSFDKESEWEEQICWCGDPFSTHFFTGHKPVAMDSILSEKDTKLIRYLAEHDHWTPFAQPQVQLRMKMPIYVARQWLRSETGRVFNEVSRRYVDDTPEFEHPELRLRPEGGIKQGSSNKTLKSGAHFVVYDETNDIGVNLIEFIGLALKVYDQLIEADVAPEVARAYLPQGVFTEVIVTGSLYYWASIVKQRLDPHAQKEVREVAEKVSGVVAPLFPVSWEALV